MPRRGTNGIVLAGRFKTRAVIFDYNGTVVDDEEFHCAAHQEAMASIGITLTRDEYFTELAGLGEPLLIRSAAGLHQHALTDIEVAKLMELRLRSYLRRVGQMLPIREAFGHYIAQLAGLVPLAIASGALEEEVETGLTTCGLRRFFDEVVTIEDVMHGKPDPETYVVTLARLNARMSAPIHPHEVVVFEDTSFGVEAAKSAGMTCIAVLGTVDKSRLEGADLIIDGFRDEVLSPAISN